MAKQDKIFGIGFPKTATSSLGDALAILGYRTLHDPYEVLPAFYPGELGQNREARRVLDSCEALVGLVCLQYQELDRRYPGSRFILTLRDEQKWLASLNTHLSRKPVGAEGTGAPDLRAFVRARLFNGRVDYEERSAAEYLAAYQAHNREVLDYFAGRDDLLVMDVTQGDGWDSLCGFLECPQPAEPFPWENKKTSQWKIMRKKIKSLGDLWRQQEAEGRR